MRVHKKILLQINSVVNYGSTGRIAEKFGLTAIANGWRSYIAFGRASGESKSELLHIGNDWDIKMHGLKTRLLDLHGFGSVNATKKLLKSISEIQPDLIILHNIHGYYINIKLLFEYLAKSRTPVFWILHDAWAFTGHCTYFDAVGCAKWLTVCSRCPQTREYPSSLVIDNSTNNFYRKKELFTSVNNLTLITVSNWLRDLVKQSFFKDHNVLTIHNGVNIKIFNPLNGQGVRLRYKPGNKFTIIGVAAQWEKRKGLDDFITLRNRLDEHYVIILVGLNKNQIKTLPVNIIGIERTENIDELAALYAASDVFLNPTYEDNFPTTNLEALACGTPVITYNTGGSPEAVDHETGIVVEKGDIDGLIRAIMEVQSKGKSHYTAKCRERAIKHFNEDEKYMEYLRLYEEISLASKH